MHEYYWENYTEMDQYGYENFDNQQALLHQVNANQDKFLALKHRLKTMLDAPFLEGWISVMTGKKSRSIFILALNFWKTAGHVPIYNWKRRSVDYSMTLMKSSYEAPGRTWRGK